MDSIEEQGESQLSSRLGLLSPNLLGPRSARRRLSGAIGQGSDQAAEGPFALPPFVGSFSALVGAGSEGWDWANARITSCGS
jgi:hypothetical protein